MNALRFAVACLLLTTTSLLSTDVSGQESPWEGVWVTDRGLLTLDTDGDSVSGTLDKKEFQGKVKDRTLDYEAISDRVTEKGRLKLDNSEIQFSGTYTAGRSNGKWQGWKRRFADNAKDDPTADFSGVWLTSSGTLVIEQSADGTVKGTIGPEGWSEIDSGKVSGGRLDFQWTIRNFKGSGWFEQTPDKNRLYGVMKSRSGESAWTGLRPVGYTQSVEPKAGTTVQGVASNGMLFNLRMPNSWQSGEKIDAIVLLHGSNWTTSGMVAVTAKKWPEIAERFAIIGIQGQNWAKWSSTDDLRFNYTYINWVGRSTLGGFPYTDRESPYLVGQLLDEFKELYQVDRFFVGGHSQGGYLTYMMAMHFPEKIAGTFPMAGGLIIQAEPDVFDDVSLKKAQRETPMYILHGKKDKVVAPSISQYAYDRLIAHDFPRVVFHQPNRGHPYDFLPVNQAIEWLDMMSTNDKAALLAFGKKKVAAKNWRNVGIVIERAKAIRGGKAFSDIWRSYEKAALPGGKRLLASIESNEDGSWVEDYLAWDEQFGFSTKSKSTIDKFKLLRAEHDEPAEKLYQEARAAFNKNDRAKGYAKYEELARDYYASRRFLTVKRALDRR